MNRDIFQYTRMTSYLVPAKWDHVNMQPLKHMFYQSARDLVTDNPCSNLQLCV
jgi:hypothetical protein